MTRARQHRRRQRTAQAAADIITAAALHFRGRHGTPQPGRSRLGLPGPSPAGLDGINVLGWGCSASGIASDGRHVWVICSDGDMLELDAATGALIRVLNRPQYGLSDPTAVASDGHHVWITNGSPGNGAPVTELDAATGALAQVISGASYQFNHPTAVTSDGHHIWITNAPINIALGGWVTELHAATGALVVNQSAFGFNFGGEAGSRGPDVASDGHHVWITIRPPAGPGGSVTELDAATGALIQVLNKPSYQFSDPSDATSDGHHIWITNPGDNSLTEFPASPQ